MSDNNMNGVVDSLIKGMETFLSSKTVVGEPTKIGDTIIVPLVDVTFGVGAGASTNGNKNGSGGGMSGKMTPSAVLVIKNGQTKLVNIKNQDTITKVLDMIPDLVDKFTSKKEDMMEDDDAVEIAFPDETKK
ncbi:MAG: GerW family sporulation protein [Lachnospiraceae bacterium]|nr:GerW family sporulation protein [Lachnospiraceae bacterium]MDD3660964.1 GerW family sporulation protein [Lachnospiraceae bacterium]